MYATKCGCIFDIVKSTEMYFLVKWYKEKSIYSDSSSKLMDKNIVQKSDIQGYMEIQTLEQYMSIFGPKDDHSHDYLRMPKDEVNRFQELMSKFSNEEFDFIWRYISISSQPIA